MIESRLVSLANGFWGEAGGRPDPPYNLHITAARVLPATVVLLPELTLKRVESWMQRRGLSYRADVADRPLRGCLIAARGHGFIFVNGDDSTDEQRFTIAHEVAHLLLEHHAPRTAAIRRHGATITEVLNGMRTPTNSERFAAASVGSDFTFATHLLERHGQPGARAAIAETEADRLAWELLAPACEIAPIIDQEDTQRILTGRYGLPSAVARRYVDALSYALAAPSFVPWLATSR